MGARKKQIIILLTIVVLLGIGLCNALNGRIAFGASLMGASIGVGVMRYFKEKQVARLRAKGLDPHDERVMYIAGLASIFTINATIFLIAMTVLLGSMIGPEVMVNPYNVLGFCLAGIVFIYTISFYFYNRQN